MPEAVRKMMSNFLLEEVSMMIHLFVTVAWMVFLAAAFLVGVFMGPVIPIPPRSPLFLIALTLALAIVSVGIGEVVRAILRKKGIEL